MSADATIPAPPKFSAPEISLFLDFDGTLVDLAERPDEVVVDRTLEILLAHLEERLSGRLAVISGRSIAQLDMFLGDTTIALVGSHGAETRLIGSATVSGGRPESLRRAEAFFTTVFGGHDGVIIEVKSMGVAIHFRLDPSVEERANAMAAEFGAASGLAVQKGKMMVELRVSGHDKGSGIASLMARSPFVGHRPIFLGDDVTDEAGFERCSTLGGAGILVGPARSTAARYRLKDVATVRSWLSAL